jgi:hypothetical protein
MIDGDIETAIGLGVKESIEPGCFHARRVEERARRRVAGQGDSETGSPGRDAFARQSCDYTVRLAA